MPKHGPAIIGQEEYDRQLAEEANTVEIDGQRSQKYGPRVLDTPDAHPHDAEAPATIAAVQEAIAAGAVPGLLFGRELKRPDGPRKGALNAIRLAATADAALVKAIDAVLEKL